MARAGSRMAAAELDDARQESLRVVCGGEERGGGRRRREMRLGIAIRVPSAGSHRVWHPTGAGAGALFNFFLVELLNMSNKV